ncbi:MAG: hypothetical protein RL134_2549 [Actinomycetota bacterium]|jgi:crossover junction endodeoxyribonuclease RusA
MLDFFVHGVPAPQGSKSAFVRGGRAVVVEGSSKSGREKQRAWRTAVTLQAIEARGEAPAIDGPVKITVAFGMPKPKSAPKSMVWTTKKPDIDKLLRSTLDGLTDAGVWNDDSQVVHVEMAKQYATNGVTGAHIVIERT